jgi:hypothetical protein
MSKIGKIGLVLLAGVFLAQCSTYTVKPDTNQRGVLNKTPRWYIKHDHETRTKYFEAATAVSPDLELAVKKSVLLAKAKLVDRINGEMNNQTTIKKDEAGTNESLTVQAGSQDVLVNVISDTVARGYNVAKQVVYTTGQNSYRSYVLLEISKEQVEEIVLDIIAKENRVAVIDNTKLEESANKVLDN